MQGRPLTPTLGDAAGALASYRKAVDVSESLAADTAVDLDLRRELGTAYTCASAELRSDARELLVRPTHRTLAAATHPDERALLAEPSLVQPGEPPG